MCVNNKPMKIRAKQLVAFAVVAASSLAIPLATSAAAAGLTNPLEGAGGTSIPAIIGNVVKALLGLSGAVALLVFVWSGILMIVAAGNPKQIQKAKASLVWASIGLVVLFTAYTLVATLIRALSTGTGQ